MNRFYYKRATLFIALLSSFLSSYSINFTELSTSITARLRDQVPGSGIDFMMLLGKIPLPQLAIDLNHVTIHTPVIQNSVVGYSKGLTISGAVLFSGSMVNVQVLVVDLATKLPPAPEKSIIAGDQVGVMMVIDLPSDWSIASLSPELSNLKQLSLPEGRLALSSFYYKEESLSVEIAPGVNFIAQLDLTGPMALVDTVLKKMGTYLSAQGERGAWFHGLLSPDISKSKFRVHVPVWFGVNFMELYRIGKFKEAPKTLESLAIGDFAIDVNVRDLSLVASAALSTKFVTQKNPLVIRSGFLLDPQQLELAVQMIGMYDPAFGLPWLAFGNFGIGVHINFVTAPVMMSTIGVPFDRVMVGGDLAIGSGENRAMAKSHAFIGFNPTKPPEMVFQGSVENVKMDALIAWVLSMMDKKSLVAGVPPLRFSIPSFTCALNSMKVIDLVTRSTKEYKAGLEGKANFSLGKFAGAVELQVQFPELIAQHDVSIRARGTIQEIKVKGFSLRGPGLVEYPQFPRGPMVDIAFNSREQFVKIAGEVSIDSLRLVQEVVLDVGASVLRGKIETRLFDVFQGMVELNLDINNVTKSKISVGMKVDGPASIAEIVKRKCEKRAHELLAKLEEVDKKIIALNIEIQEQQLIFERELSEDRAQIEAIIRDRKQTIEDYQERADTYKKECQFNNPTSWFGPCANYVKKNVDASLEELSLDVDRLTHRFQEAGGFVDAYAREKFMRLKTKALELKKMKNAISLAAIKGLAEIAGGIAQFTVQGGATLSFEELSKGKIPEFYFKYSGNVFGKTVAGEIKNLRFDTKSEEEASLTKITEVIQRDLEAKGGIAP